MHVVESSFTVAGVPGALWTPAGDSVALILMGHGGGLHKTHPAVAAIDAPGHGDRPRNTGDAEWVIALRAAREAGRPIGPIVAAFNASLAERAVPEWRAVLDALLAERGPDIPVGYTGMTLATQIGIPLAASEPRIRAPVFGGAVRTEPLLAAARKTTIPIHYLLPWDDRELDRATALAMFDAFGSEHKTRRGTGIRGVLLQHHRRLLSWILSTPWGYAVTLPEYTPKGILEV